MSPISAARTFRPAILLMSALTLAACSSAASPSPAPTATPAEATATPTEPTATPPEATATPTEAAAAYTVNVATGTVGDYLTGEGGTTLYVKQGDSTTATNCTGGCLDSWPPFTVEAGEQTAAGAGVSGTLATYARPEGTTQVTYNGQPLYYFSGDTAAGDTNGQGLAGVWSVAAP